MLGCIGREVPATSPFDHARLIILVVLASSFIASSSARPLTSPFPYLPNPLLGYHPNISLNPPPFLPFNAPSMHRTLLSFPEPLANGARKPNTPTVLVPHTPHCPPLIGLFKALPSTPLSPCLAAHLAAVLPSCMPTHPPPPLLPGPPFDAPYASL